MKERKRKKITSRNQTCRKKRFNNNLLLPGPRKLLISNKREVENHLITSPKLAGVACGEVIPAGHASDCGKRSQARS